MKRGFDTFDGRFVGEEEEEEQEKIQRRSNKQKTESKKKTKNSQEHSSKNKSKRKKQREKKKQKEKKKRIKQKKKKTQRSRSKRVARQSIRLGPQRKQSKEGQEAEHMSGLYSRKAVQLIKKAASDQPLFLYLSLFTKSYPRRVGRVRSRQKQLELFRRKNLQELDDSIASVVQALKSSGRYANSVIIFISDNGAREWSDPSLPNHNAPLRGAKGSVYEGGTKVPALIHSPLVIGGRR